MFFVGVITKMGDRNASKSNLVTIVVKSPNLVRRVMRLLFQTSMPKVSSAKSKMIGRTTINEIWTKAQNARGRISTFAILKDYYFYKIY